MEQKIKELETLRDSKNTLTAEKRAELGIKMAEVRNLEKAISDNAWENTEEAKELEELKIAQKWNRYYGATPPVEE